MSYYSDYFAYAASVELGKGDPPFYGLLMAAMRKADTPNSAKFQAFWPEVWEDLQARYNAPGGVLDTDPEGIKRKVWGPEAVA